MKVLFGLSNDDTVKSIVKFYEETYKEKLEYKNVYYFKQAVQEVHNGGYDRVVLLEDLEKYPTNNYAQIDDYIFKNVDAISDEFDAKHIIFVASDRRKLGDSFLAKLFNIGVYSVLTGSNRTKSKVCEAINSPKKKKDVKKYYEESLDKNVYSKVEVSEVEIQRILAYYRNQEGNTSKYVEIFDRICSQYTNEQMRIIIQFLEPDVKQFLEVNSEKYKAISNMPSAVVPQVAEQQPIIDENNKEKTEVIKIEKQPEIIEKIVVKQSNQPAPVITSVMEKEVVKSVYEIPKDYRKVVCMIGAPKSFSPDFEGFIVLFTPSFAADINLLRSNLPFMTELKYNPLIKLKAEECELFTNFCNFFYDIEGNKLISNSPEARKCLLSSLLYTLGALYRRQLPQASMERQGRANIIFKKFLALLVEHYTRERSVAFYANQLCITPEYLGTICREISSKLATDIIASAVIMDAKAKLHSSDLTVQEISNSLNFPNASFFGRYFKRHTGFSPLQYRESY